MKIIIDTDNHITGTADLKEEFSAEITKHLEKFSSHITTVQVNLSDENSSKSGPDDKKCSFEVRLRGEKPILVSNKGSTIREAFQGSISKAVRVTKDTLEKKRP